MLLKSYYDNRHYVIGNSYLMLTLNYNSVSRKAIHEISEFILMTIKTNWHQKNCKYVVHYDNKTRYTSDLLKHFNKCSDNDFYAAGYVLSEKGEIKKICEESLGFYNNDKEIGYDELIADLTSYFSQYTISFDQYDKSDFSINFRTESYEEVCSFECQLKINTFSMGYRYEEILKQYKDLISYFDANGNLFAAYIDVNSFDGFFEYEYCYKNSDEKPDSYTVLRNYSWAAYLSDRLVINDISDNLKEVADVFKLGNGWFYSCRCDVDKFSYCYKRTLFETFDEILPNGFGLVDISTLIKSGFKPCCKNIHIFKRIGFYVDNEYDVEEISYYALFKKGFKLKDVIKQLDLMSKDENFAEFKYVETIDLHQQ